MRKALITRLHEGLTTPVTLTDARQRYSDFRVSLGFPAGVPPLLTWPKGNTKFRKGGAQYGLALLPHRMSGENLCVHSTKGCRSLCLNSAGRGAQNNVQAGREAKSKFFLTDPAAFGRLLRQEIGNLPKGSGLRLNTFSDVPWALVWPELFEDLAKNRPDLNIYDYTKYPPGSLPTPANYHVTYSASERLSDDQVRSAVEAGQNVAVVLRMKRKDDMPVTWKGMPLVDGDKTDARYDDPRGVVVGLRAKGKAYRSDSDFVRNL